MRMIRSVQVDASAVQMVVGKIDHLDADGVAWVTSPRNSEPVRARVILNGPWTAPHISVCAEVLLLLQEGEPPVILGNVGQTVLESESNIRRKDILIDAAESITLSCGASSLSMRSDGKVVVKGRRILSRASQTNKIRGGAVLIN